MPSRKGMDCEGLSHVNLVKLGTIIDRNPIPVWFQLKVDQNRDCIGSGRQKQSSSHYSLKVILVQGGDQHPLLSEFMLHIRLYFPHTDPTN